MQHADPADDAPVTAARIAATRAALVRIRDGQITAFDEMHTDAQCIAAGGTTQSVNVLNDAFRFLVIAHEEIATHGDMIACDPVFVSYFNHCIEALESARRAQKNDSPGDPVAERDDAEKRARGQRSELVRIMKLVAGSNADAQRDLARALGSANSVADVGDSTGELIPVARRWVRDAQGSMADRIHAFRLTTALIDSVARAHQKLVDGGAETIGASKSQRDKPAVNLAEGRVLYPMKVLYETFEAAHSRNALVRRLVPSAGTRHFIAGHKAAKPAKSPPSGATGTGA